VYHRQGFASIGKFYPLSGVCAKGFPSFLVLILYINIYINIYRYIRGEKRESDVENRGRGEKSRNPRNS
jgi:hypothetical protein